MTIPAPAAPTSHGVSSQRLRLHYLDWGNPDAPPLLLIHGGRDHGRSWDWVARALRRDWHVIVPDLRGHGDSGWLETGAYDMAGLVYDLARLIGELDLAPVTIVGHSLGGNVALRYAGIYPGGVRRLVAIEGLGLSPTAQAEQDAVPIAERMRTWIERQDRLSARPPRRMAAVEEALARMRAAHPRLSEEQAAHLTSHGVRRNEDGSVSWKYDPRLLSMPPADLTVEQKQALWARITCPTLLVYGSESWASNPEADGRMAHFPNARLAMIEGAGHWVQHDRFDRFMAALNAFLGE